jgi:hypothetical protein
MSLHDFVILWVGITIGSLVVAFVACRAIDRVSKL